MVKKTSSTGPGLLRVCVFGEQHNVYDFIAHLSLISILQKKRKTKEKINKYKS